MRKRFLPILFAILLCACGMPSRTRSPVPPQPIDVQAAGFALYIPVPIDATVAAPAYTPDLGLVVNLDSVAGLSEAQRAVLEENGFVVVPQGYEQIYTIYKDAKNGSIPIFVTTDSVLHTFHVFYDYALRLAETEHFMDDLKALNATMLQAAEADYEGTTGPVREAAFQNLAFFAVGSRLLDPGADIPSAVRKEVQQELDLIAGHTGFKESPIFGYIEDYSQYVPRGHYTRNEAFQRYFRAMMWFGRMSFHLVNPRDPAAAIRETRGALMIVRALYNARAGDEAALKVWERIYEPTAFFVGAADDLTVYDYATVSQQVYGGLPDPAALADESALNAFVDGAKKLRAPQIVGGFVTDQEDPKEVTMGFRFMGQRFIPDSYIFQQMVYNQVGPYRGSGQPFTMSPSQIGPIRGFPRGLDIQAALGSARALEVLVREGDTDYEGYHKQLQKMRDEFAALSEEQWTANLYWNWLYTLRPLLEPKGKGYPYFMQSPAWADKDLHTWLGSWTELRHDTILYAKQSYTVYATSLPPQPEATKGYVEPQPAIYARLAAITQQMQSGLSERGLLNEEMGSKLATMEQLLLSLKTISEKELHGAALSDDEYTLIRNVGATLEELVTSYSEEVKGQITSETDQKMALVADVHTDSNTGQVLEEGVGDAFPIYVVVLVDGQQQLALGGVFSYYEFKWPMSDRLTDEKWQGMSDRPGWPAWTGSFIAE